MLVDKAPESSRSGAAMVNAVRGAAIALVVMVAAILVLEVFQTSYWLAYYGTAANPPSSWGCDDGNECTIDLRVGGPDVNAQYCEYKPATRNKPCTNGSQCFSDSAALTCDGLGSCNAMSGPAAQCKGFCPWHDTQGGLVASSPSCTLDLFPFTTYDNSSIPWDAPIDASWLRIPNDGTYNDVNPACIAQQCTRTAVQIRATLWNLTAHTLSAYAEVMYPAVTQSCLDSLDTRSPLVGCIVATEEALDSQWLSNLINANFGELPQNISVASAGRICSFSYACAAQNVSAYYDVNNTLASFPGKRALPGGRRSMLNENALAQMLAQWAGQQDWRRMTVV